MNPLRWGLAPCLGVAFGLLPSAWSAVGSLDASFNPPGANGWVQDSAVQADGKIVIVGTFTTVHGEGRTRVARLLPNGNLDASFNPGTGPNGAVNSVALQPDGKVLICGAFTQVAGAPRNLFARLNTDGTLDNSYAAAQPMLASGTGLQILALADGKSLLVGPSAIYFSFSPLTVRNGFMRLNPNGTCDTTFPNLPLTSAGVFAGAVTPAGNYLVGGSFSTADGSERTNLVQVNPGGVIDTSFAANPFQGGAGVGHVRTIRTMPDGRIVFTYPYGGTTNWIVRLRSNGQPDGSFGRPHADQAIATTAVQPDGRIWIAGDLQHVNGVQRLQVARLTANGALDTDFDPGTGAGTSVFSVVLQPDGKVLLGGAFNGFNEFYHGTFVRLLGDLSANQPRLVRGTFSLSAFSTVGKTYTLQYKTALGDHQWQSLPAVPGTGQELILFDPSATSSTRVYRVVEN